MYGYIVPVKATLPAQDFILYRSFYCGMCCQTGKLYGQLPRFTTNYDFAFLSALLHDYASMDIVIEEHKCVLNPITKKAVLQPNPLLERIAAANIMLSYQKASDGVADKEGIKYRLVRGMLLRPFRKAKAQYGDIWAEIELAYKKLRAIEEEYTAGIDRAAQPFAQLLSELPALILGKKTDDNLCGLCYNVGKFVYTADALDDIGDDFGKKRYNPFLAMYGDYTDRKSFIQKHRADFEFCLYSLCAAAEKCFYSMHFTQSYTLLKNIVCEGMREKAKELLDSAKKLPPPRI